MMVEVRLVEVGAQLHGRGRQGFWEWVGFLLVVFMGLRGFGLGVSLCRLKL